MHYYSWTVKVCTPLLALSCSGSSVLLLMYYCSMSPAVCLLLQGDMNRKIAEHALNTHSSRSHCIFTIHVEVSVTCLPLSQLSHSFTSLSLSSQSRSRTHSNAEYTISKLNLVDLAGSERLSKTNVSICHSHTSCYTFYQWCPQNCTTFKVPLFPFPPPLLPIHHLSSLPSPQSSGVTQKEAMYINKSLSFLEQVQCRTPSYNSHTLTLLILTRFLPVCFIL